MLPHSFHSYKLLTFLFVPWKCDTPTIDKNRRHTPCTKESSLHKYWNFNDSETTVGGRNFSWTNIYWWVFKPIYLPVLMSSSVNLKIWLLCINSVGSMFDVWLIASYSPLYSHWKIYFVWLNWHLMSSVFIVKNLVMAFLALY